MGLLDVVTNSPCRSGIRDVVCWSVVSSHWSWATVSASNAFLSNIIFESPCRFIHNRQKDYSVGVVRERPAFAKPTFAALPLPQRTPDNPYRRTGKTRSV